ncbi:hypothetical protein BH23BAC3_BH23BAC3_34070 [soil metagenome]
MIKTKNSGIQVIKEAGAKILRESKLHPSVLARIPVDTELISVLRNHPLVDIFEPNATGGYLNITWNIDRINAPDIWNQTTGSGARLLIIDSGVDNNHTYLDPEVIHGCDNTNGVDQLGHGTSVSGIAGVSLGSTHRPLGSLSGKSGNQLWAWALVTSEIF